MSEKENMHKIDFVVPLSGSQLFDIHSYAIANNLCTRFPGLNFDYDDKTKIRIHGELNDYWYDEWHKAIFSIGEVRADDQ